MLFLFGGVKGLEAAVRILYADFLVAFLTASG